MYIWNSGSLTQHHREDLEACFRKHLMFICLSRQGASERMADITVQSTNLENIVVGELMARWNSAGTRILRYHIDFRHKKLNVHRELSAPELFILQSKVDALVAAWDEKYSQYQLRNLLSTGKETADELTIQALSRLESLTRVLASTLAVNDRVDWENLKDQSVFRNEEEFPEPKPKMDTPPPPVRPYPKITFFDLMLGRKAAKLDEAEERHREATSEWQAHVSDLNQAYRKQVDSWEERRRQFFAEQERLQREFLAEQAARNAVVDQLREAVRRGEPQAVIEHASLVLDASDYQGLFERSFVVQYHQEEKLLLLAYDLPSPDDLPIVKSVRFIKATGELKETHITEREKKANFEAVAYQICLRTIHELFEADEHANINSILFNGFVNYVDPRNGQEARSCIISVLVNRDDFEAIDLARIEPKSCFKSLKGVSAATLGSITSIAPVMQMDREDRRFVDAQIVTIDEETNLAAMPWEDFEHLVRELFEKEFGARGGEVKITRASRDAGVDAIAFDPDPITGGKVVIQAKRYTRTVGVSAVRDLYGTVLNEGASKGILVTTADYGPDAHQFANGKPLTLLSGSHLLHLLERHGYRAKIDLREARETA